MSEPGGSGVVVKVPAQRSLDELATQASPESAALARWILEQDLSDRRWAAQVGPAFTQSGTARLLGVSQQAVSKSRRLVRVIQRDGRPCYPRFQFDGRQQVAGVGDVVAVLGQVLEGLTVASWLTGSSPALGARPIDALRAGRTDEVLAAARHLAAAAA